MQPYFIAVHAGAGYHGYSKELSYRVAMQQALKAAAECLDSGGSSMDAVKSAICVLEDAPVTNAGTGSNLSMSGGVECDASIMSGDGTQAAVGAVPGVTNPISAAHLLAVKAQQPLLCGLVPPTFLAGDAARRWALAQGLAAAPTPDQAYQWLVTPEAKSAWQQYTNILAQEQAAQAQPSAPGAPTPAAPAAVTPGSTQQQHGQQQSSNLCQPEAADASMPPVKRQRLEPSPTAAEAAVQPPASAVATTDVSGQQVALPARLADVCDTVGAVVVDASGCVAAGVSSGGLALKTEGRVGEAAVIGAGCWAADGTWASVTPTKPGQAQSAAATRAGAGLHPLPGVAVSTSGVGERLMSCSLARSAAVQLQVAPHSMMPTQAAEDVIRGQLLSQRGPWDAGLVAVRVNTSRADSSSSSSSENGSGSASIEVGVQSSKGAAGQAAGTVAWADDDICTAHCTGDTATAAAAAAAAAAECTSVHRAAGNGLIEQQHNCCTQVAATAGGDKPVAPAAPLLRVEFVAAFTSASFAVGYLARNGRQAVLSDVKVLRSSCPHPTSEAAAGSAAAAAAGGGSEAVVDSSIAVASVHPPTVTCMEVSCSWPLQELQP